MLWDGMMDMLRDAEYVTTAAFSDLKNWFFLGNVEWFVGWILIGLMINFF